MKYTFATPVMVGDPGSQIAIPYLQLASISINFQNRLAAQGNAILSIVLEHPPTGYSMNIVYNGTAGSGDPTSLAFWTNLDSINNVVTKAIFNKLTTDGKLPTGTLA